MVKTGTFLWGRGAPPQKCPNQIGYRYIKQQIPNLTFLNTAERQGLVYFKLVSIIASCDQVLHNINEFYVKRIAPDRARFSPIIPALLFPGKLISVLER